MTQEEMDGHFARLDQCITELDAHLKIARERIAALDAKYGSADDPQ